MNSSSEARNGNTAAAMNETMRKFGYPTTLIAEYERWCVLLRPAQVTLGALVLACKDEARSFAAIAPESFAELSRVTRDVETGLKAFRPYDKLNWLMLMMVDPDVHFHVLPRYAALQDWHGTAFPDAGWPGAPDLAQAVKPKPGDLERLVGELRAVWPKRLD